MTTNDIATLAHCPNPECRGGYVGDISPENYIYCSVCNGDGKVGIEHLLTMLQNREDTLTAQNKKITELEAKIARLAYAVNQLKAWSGVIG